MVETVSEAPVFKVQKVPFDAPWKWMARGWSDLWSFPLISLSYGIVFMIVAMALLFGLTLLGWQSLFLALAGGFVLLGPMLAVGLYEVSRRQQSGEPGGLSDIVVVGVRSPGQLAFMGALLLFVYLVWIEIAFLLFMLFFGAGGLPPVQDFISELLFTPRGLGLLIVGTIVGAVLAGIVFLISAVSIPILMICEVDIVTAIMVSINAVAENPRAMMLWAGLIAAIMICSVATMFVGLVIAFPLVGHATWHAFSDLIEIDQE